MQLSNFSETSGAAEWLVSNGTVTVGPVQTDLLLRGVLHGRVPSNAWVRQTSWPAWRELERIREVTALRRVLARQLDDSLEPSQLVRGAEAVAHAKDFGEALLIALHAAAQATSATVGLAHRVRAPLLRFTTSCCYETSLDRLGEVLPEFDPALALARRGDVQLLAGSGAAGGSEHAAAERLSPKVALAGVALLPLCVAGRLQGMLELGRSDHAFRRSDYAELSEFSKRVARALGRLL